jgi:hypothetical protein
MHNVTKLFLPQEYNFIADEKRVSDHCYGWENKAEQKVLEFSAAL